MAAAPPGPLLDVLTLDRPEQLKALGHPLRLRVLETLGTGTEEHLTNLVALESKTFRFFAAPPAIAGGTSFVVRAFAVCDSI